MLKFEYKKSNIHGFGLFATCDIKNGENICYYFGEKIKTSDVKDSTYALKYDNKYTIIGETDINILPKMGYGQFLNDGGYKNFCSKIFINGMNSIMENKYINNVSIDLFSENLLYVYNSIINNNVNFNTDKKISICSNRNIKKGTEFSVSYGFKYWLYTYLKKYKEDIINIQKTKYIINNFDIILASNLKQIANHIRQKNNFNKKQLEGFNVVVKFIEKNIDNVILINY